MTPFYSKHNSDCLRACISSILNIEIDFPKLNENWFLSLNNFLLETYKTSIHHQKNPPSDNFFIAVYKDPHKNLNYHAVVCDQSNEIIHNPSKYDDYDYKTLSPDYFIIAKTK